MVAIALLLERCSFHMETCEIQTQQNLYLFSNQDEGLVHRIYMYETPAVIQLVEITSMGTARQVGETHIVNNTRYEADMH